MSRPPMTYEQMIDGLLDDCAQPIRTKAVFSQASILLFAEDIFGPEKALALLRQKTDRESNRAIGGIISRLGESGAPRKEGIE